MAGDGGKDGLILHAPLGAGEDGRTDAVPDGVRPLFPALGVLGILPHQFSHLVLGDLLGRVVEQGGQRSLVLIDTVALRQLNGHFFYVQGVLVALVTQPAAHKLFCLFLIHL